MNYNKVVLIGRLTKDPELRYLPTTGDAVAKFTLAVNRPFKNAQGVSEADFIPVVVWRKQAENVTNYLKKGAIALIEGRIQVREFLDREQKRCWMTEVNADRVVFGPKNNNEPYSQQESTLGIEISDDDVPF